MVEQRQRRERGTYSLGQRGSRREACYTVPIAERSDPSKRERICAQGATDAEAVANLMAKLRANGKSLPAAPSNSTAVAAVPTTSRAPYDPNRPGSDFTFDEWAEEWKRDWIGGQGDDTRDRYFGHIRNHISPHIGTYTLDRLSAKVLKEKWWDVIQAKRKKRGGVETDEPLLSASGLSNVYKTLRMVLTAAHDKLHSPMNLKASLFHPPHQGERPETDEEIAAITQRLLRLFWYELPRDDPRWARFMLALYGLRIGERCGLTVSSVDLTNPKKPVLRVRQQLAFAKQPEGWKLKPATKNGTERVLPLFGVYLEAAQRLLAQRAELAARPDWNPEPKFQDLLMLGPGGKLITTRQDAAMWKELTGGDLRGHVARHATGQIFAELDVSPDVAKLILGHQSDTYGHYYRTISTRHAHDELLERMSVLDPETAAPIEPDRQRGNAHHNALTRR